jgi:hypothetical protein
MRIQNERSGSSSLFAHPMAIEPIPEAPEPDPSATQAYAEPAKAARGVLEGRMEAALSALSAVEGSPSAVHRQGHLALLKRWYYRPEGKRTGEIFFPERDGDWPIKALLRGAGRVFAAGFKSRTS